MIAVAIWILGAAAGSLYSLEYATAPTATLAAGSRWPDETSCTLASHQPTLVMFVHPQCPCSRASLNELAVLMARCQGRVHAQVLFMKPPSTPADWARTDLWNSAAGIPGIIPQQDVEGAEQRRFAARVSGEVFLYRPDGALLFHGGITAGRGHSGDNDGRSAVELLLLNQDCRTVTTAVFGCALESPVSASARPVPGPCTRIDR